MLLSVPLAAAISHGAFCSLNHKNRAKLTRIGKWHDMLHSVLAKIAGTSSQQGSTSGQAGLEAWNIRPRPAADSLPISTEITGNSVQYHHISTIYGASDLNWDKVRNKSRCSSTLKQPDNQLKPCEASSTIYVPQFINKF
jgi:hypothetical protein